MRNNIYRSFLKKVLKSEAFVSLAIVFVLALGIIGTSYALYMDVDTDTDYQLVKVGDLDVYIGFDNGDNTVTLSNVTPTDDEIALESSDNVFSFYIYNGGSYTADYSIKLVPDYATTDSDGNSITPNEINPEYIRFQVCKDNSQNCKDIEKLSDYVTVDENNNITDSKAIYVDELSPKKESDPSNPSAYYFIRMWLTSEGYGVNGSNYDTNVIGKTIKYKVNVESTNASGLLDNKNTLAGKLLSDERVTINNTIPTFDGIADYKVTGDPTSGELGMFKAEDDYGISYYYRGAQSHNYVNFAGFTWRVVRINGDGSIRLILDGTLNTVKHNEESTYIYENESLQSITTDGLIRVLGSEGNGIVFKDSGYTGYMYGEFQDIVGDSVYNATGGSTSYDEAHSNKKSSQIKEYIEKFYEIYLAEYESDYMADTLFCGDKTRSQNNLTTGYGLEREAFYWGAYDRLANETKAIPSLKCVDPNIIADKSLSESQLAYSRYTSKLETSSTTSKNVLINNDLTYPIGLLSFDETIMAGAFYNKENNNFYLKTTNEWLTMTPATKPTGINLSRYFYIENNGMSNCSAYGIARPVINLKSDVLWASGDGTVSTPYEVKLY